MIRFFQSSRLQDGLRIFLSAFGAFVVVLALALAFGPSIRQSVAHFMKKFEQRVGIVVGTVEVRGNQHLSKKTIFHLARITPHVALSTCDPKFIATQLKMSGWVKNVIVRRQFPNKLQIYLEEKIPKALWTAHGRTYIISRDGSIIAPLDGNNVIFFSFMPLVQARAENLKALPGVLKALESHGLMPRIRRIVMASEGRWDLLTRNHILIKLPRGKIEKGLDELVVLQRQFHVFKRDISSLDLRIPGAPIITTKHPVGGQSRAI